MRFKGEVVLGFVFFVLEVVFLLVLVVGKDWVFININIFVRIKIDVSVLV